MLTKVPWRRRDPRMANPRLYVDKVKTIANANNPALVASIEML